MPIRRRTTTRTSTRRKPQRRRRYRFNFRKLALNILLLTLLGVLATYVLTSPELNIKRIRLVGAQTVSADDIMQVLYQQKGHNILLINKRKIASKISRDPVIKTVRIYRQLPNSLAVRVIERKPDFVLHVGGKYYEVDSLGLPFREIEKSLDNVQIMTSMVSMDVEPGKPIDSKQFTIARDCLLMAREKKIPTVSEITIDQSSDLCLNVRDGFRIDLGRPVQLSDKLDKAVRVVEEYPNFKLDGEYIDVSSLEAGAAFTKRKSSDTEKKATQPAAKP